VVCDPGDEAVPRFTLAQLKEVLRACHDRAQLKIIVNIAGA
jgi:hypothetical protein